MLFCFSIGKASLSALEHRGRVAEVGIGERRRPEHIDRGHREQRRADAVPAHVEQVEGHVVVVDVVMAEGIAAEFGRGDQEPVGRRILGARLGQDRHDVGGRLGDLLVQPVLRLLEEPVGIGELVLHRLAMLDRRRIEEQQVLILGLQPRDLGARLVERLQRGPPARTFPMNCAQQPGRWASWSDGVRFSCERLRDRAMSEQRARETGFPSKTFIHVICTSSKSA